MNNQQMDEQEANQPQKKQHRLFWKILGVFWLTIALTTVANITITHQISDIENKTKNITRQIESFANDAVIIYETSGEKSLNQWYKRIYRKHEMRAVLLNKANARIGKPVKRDYSKDPSTSLNPFRESRDSRPLHFEKPLLRRLPRSATHVSITSSSEQTYTFRLLPSPYLQKELGSPADYRWLRMLTIFAFTLLASLWLSRHVVKPVVAINTASQKMASGELSVRVKPEIGERKDELGALGESFDLMANQLEKTITGQKQLLRDISHEIRTPLTRQRLAIDLIRDELPVDDNYTGELLNKVENQNNKLNELIGNLLTLNRLDEDSSLPLTETVEIASLMTSLLDDAEIEAATKNIHLQSHYSDNYIIKGNKLLLERAFENIIGNALKYSPDNATLSVTISTVDAETIVEITDQGPGLTEEEQRNVFIPFYRADNSRTQNTGGYGLGLAIVKKVVSMHQGNISLHTPDGGGLCVTVRLPHLNV